MANAMVETSEAETIAHSEIDIRARELAHAGMIKSSISIEQRIAARDLRIAKLENTIADLKKLQKRARAMIQGSPNSLEKKAAMLVKLELPSEAIILTVQSMVREVFDDKDAAIEEPYLKLVLKR